MASHRSRSFADAAPSVPRATGTPAASRSGIAGEAAGQLLVRRRAVGDGRAGWPRRARCRGRRGARRGRARCRGPSSPVSRSTSIGVRPWRARTAVELGDGLAGVDVDAGAAASAASSPTAPELGLVEQVRAVRADPAPARRRGRRAARRPTPGARRSGGRRRRGTRRTPARRAGRSPAASATAAAASGKKYMSRAVVMPARRHSATAERRAGGDGRRRQHGALGGQAGGRGSRRGRGRRRGRGTSSSPGGCGR